MFSDFNSEFFSWVRGALLVLVIINASVYIQNKKKLFLYYSLYLLFIFLYFFKPVAPAYLFGFYTYFGYSLLYVAFAFYTEFTRILVSTKVKIPKWDCYFKIQMYCLLLYSLSLPVIYYFFGFPVYRFFLLVFSILLGLYSIFAYVVISSIKRRNVTLFIFGSASFLILGNVSTFFKTVYKDNLHALSFEPMAFTYFGAILEALVFTYIMGAVFKQILEKKTDLKIQYVLKGKEASELKMKALQGQMNPHFLFNSLNSINNFVLQNKVEEASDYITSFSKLIRKVLKNSENLQIPLNEELEILEMYINLEKSRISGGFEYKLIIDPRLVLNEIKVPPLFLQPYIENSIWHGLAGNLGEKRIQLDVIKEDEDIVFLINDNGPGVNKAVIDKNRDLSKRNFFGSIVTEKRIRLMHEAGQVEIYTENISKNGITGTLVYLRFPLKKVNRSVC
tara:strand:+ start:33249 stop:34595 length:1347 start_codon:yes stop_codon:yes gene_type:complete